MAFDITERGVVRHGEVTATGDENPIARRDRSGPNRKRIMCRSSALIATVTSWLDHTVFRRALVGSSRCSQVSRGLVLPGHTSGVLRKTILRWPPEENNCCFAKNYRTRSRRSSSSVKGKADDSRTIGEKRALAKLLEAEWAHRANAVRPRRRN